MPSGRGGAGRRVGQPTVPQLSFEEQVGQVIMGIWSGDLDRLADLVALGRVGGLLLPLAGAAAAPELATTLNRLQRLATYPLLVAADLIGGWPVANEQALGCARRPDLARRCGALLGAHARAVGIHLALDPCLDVWREPAQVHLARRSFGENPTLVAGLGAACVEGLQASGALATGHRFPGGGGALYDEARKLPVLSQDRQTLEKMDLAPYLTARRAGLGAIMSGHLHVKALDNLPNRLATHSSAVVEGLLRGTLGFTGLLLSDNLDAPEVSARYAPGQAAILAFAAGHDLLVTESPAEVYRALYEVLLHGDVPPARLQEAVSRIWAAKQWLGLPAERYVETPPPALKEQEALGREVARAALTLIHGERHALAGRRALVLANRGPGRDGTRADAELRRLAESSISPASFHVLEPHSTPAQVDALLASGAGAEAALVFLDLVGASPEDASAGEATVALAQALKRTGLPVGVVVMGDPYALPRFRDADLLLYQPGDTVPYLEAVFAHLLGQVEATGRLPITVPGLAG